MTNEKQRIEPDDIEVKDIKRRKFVMGAAGAIAATGMVSIAGCGGGGSDDCNTDTGDLVRADSDPSDPIRSDSNAGDTCDSD